MVLSLCWLHGVSAMKRNVVRHPKSRDGQATNRGESARSVENVGELKTLDRLNRRRRGQNGTSETQLTGSPDSGCGKPSFAACSSKRWPSGGGFTEYKLSPMIAWLRLAM